MTGTTATEIVSKMIFLNPSAIPTATILQQCGRGGGLEVTILAFYFDNLSLNLADYKKCMSKRQKKMKKLPLLAHL